MYRNLFALLLICSVAGTQLLAQGFLRAEGKDIVNEDNEAVLLRGMGLGGWMLQEGYMLQTAGFANAQHKIREKIEGLIGTADTDAFYEAWLSNHVRRIDIDSLHAWGFNSVRLPMHYNLFTLPIEAEPIEGEHTWLEKGFELTDSLLAWCRPHGMYVVLDLHAAPGGQGRDEGISDYDTSKPSLWESKANRDKTVALWQRIAERYKDEPLVAGYDLINETNWAMEGNVPLRALYEEIVDSIRAVDTKHIIFIEGNWFANDFTGLTPPWAENLVYSPHKYWSINDQASIQWVLDIREQHNVPLYFGEWGENSNQWFRNAIRLFEEHNIGWACWPMKKVESIAGPLSIIKTDNYQTLLDFWNNGGATPSADFAKATLMDLTEKLKLENCFYQRDVIDAMFRQINSDEAAPFTVQEVPGVVYASEFDLGGNDIAYFDTDIANYQVSTGNYTAWNRGWTYRNDGVDLERSEDNTNTNGYNVGFVKPGEWIQYSIAVTEPGLYDVEVRVASDAERVGKLHFEVDGAAVSGTASVTRTNGWQTWKTVLLPNVILEATDRKLQLHIDDGEFNIGSFNFIRKGDSQSVGANYLSAITLTENAVQLNVNKPLTTPLPTSPAGFSLQVNGSPVTINSVVADEGSSRALRFEVDHRFRSSEVITISYNGTAISATDGTTLSSFSQRPVENTIAIVHALPGKIEAEDFFFQSGIELENTTDAGGGENIGFLDENDFADYKITVAQAGIYRVDYRTAALSETGQVKLQLIGPNEEVTDLHTVSFASTGGWQTWRTTSAELTLPAGEHQLRMVITQPLFNINWMEFDLLTSTETMPLTNLILYPNPAHQQLTVQAQLPSASALQLEVFNVLGQRVHQQFFPSIDQLKVQLDVSTWPRGAYFMRLGTLDGDGVVRRFLVD
ncbi:MAG: carbohydrate-binding protein [Bacteroidota bacterium]